MQIQLSYEEVITEQKRIIGDLQHELMMQNLLNKKQSEKLNEYEAAEAERNAAQIEAPKALRKLSAAVEDLPGIEAPQTPIQPA